MDLFLFVARPGVEFSSEELALAVTSQSAPGFSRANLDSKCYNNRCRPTLGPAQSTCSFCFLCGSLNTSTSELQEGFEFFMAYEFGCPIDQK